MLSPTDSPGHPSCLYSLLATRYSPARYSPARYSPSSMRQRIGAELEPHGFRPVRLAAFEVEHGALAVGRPQLLSLPAGIRIIDPAVHILGEEAHRIRHGDVHEFPVHQRQY